jgi:FkbM family methyltransferase
VWLAKGLPRGIGIEIARWRPPERRLAAYLEGHGIRTVVDVGANSGQFGTTLREAGFRGRIISFEPLAGPFAALSEAAATDPLWEAHRLALGDTPGRMQMNVASNSASSSFLEMEQSHVVAQPAAGYVEREEVEVARLDDVAPSLQLEGPTLLKLDVQGYHLTVLRGAAETLRTVTALQ